MGISEIDAREIGVELVRLLGNWVQPHRLGWILDASGDFIMPNTDLRALDVLFAIAQAGDKVTFCNKIEEKCDRASTERFSLNLDEICPFLWGLGL